MKPSYKNKGLISASRRALNVVRFNVQNAFLLGTVRRRGTVTEAAGRVTVITATYNRPHLLAEAIESVRSQTYENWEHIIVSDGPDDRVQPLVRKYNDPRIRAYHTRRFAVMGNYQRNFALKHATGQFLLYLDDDNIIYPTCLATMVAGLSAPEVGYVVCPIHYGSGILSPPPEFEHEQIDLLNFMVRRELVVRIGGQNSRYSADYHLIRQVAASANGEFLDTLIGHHR